MIIRIIKNKKNEILDIKKRLFLKSKHFGHCREKVSGQWPAIDVELGLRSTASEL